MLLTPLASPSKYQAALCRPLPKLAHEHNHKLGQRAFDRSDDGEDGDDGSLSGSGSDSDKFEFDFDEDDESDSGSNSDEDILDVVATCNAKPLSSVLPVPAPEDGPNAHSDQLALPVELILSIVELASTHRKTALTLCRVSSWIHAVVLPTLYRTLVLHEDRERPMCITNAMASNANSNVNHGQASAPVAISMPFRTIGEGRPADDHDECECKCGEGSGDGDGDDAGEEGSCLIFGSSSLQRQQLANPLEHVRSLWVDVVPERAPYSLDAFPNLEQLALPLEAHATICNSTRYRNHPESEPAPEIEVGAGGEAVDDRNALELQEVDGTDTNATDDKDLDREEHENEAEAEAEAPIADSDSDSDCDDLAEDNDFHDDFGCESDFKQPQAVRSFTVLGQSHPHRWAPLTSNAEGRTFLRGVTHMRILNLCLSHYSMFSLISAQSSSNSRP